MKWQNWQLPFNSGTKAPQEQSTVEKHAHEFMPWHEFVRVHMYEYYGPEG